MTRNLILSTILFSSLLITTKAQVKEDSIKTYRLKDVTIMGILELEPESFIKIAQTEIKKADAGGVIDLGSKIPSIKAQTNSRGESLFFFRGSGERQITLFMDGIPINMPWDNRIDLSLLPAEIVSEITLLKGISPAIFGANAISGVINISSINPIENIRSGKFSIQIGETGYNKFSGLYSKGGEKLSYLISAGYRKSDGYKLPSSFLSSANPTKERLNSYINSKSVFGKINYKFSNDYSSDLIFSFIDSKKGVPPEIGVANQRYWQYPEWKNIILAANGNLKFSESQSYLFYSFSINKFNMQINQYKNASFTTIDDIEKNNDLVFRTRLIYTNILSGVSLLKIALNGQSFRHKEEFLSSNFISQTYSENILSVGAEYEYVQNKYVLSVGSGIDWIGTPKTGDKPGKESLTDYALNAAFVYLLDNNFSLRINGGRKTRFPTLRETFSGALGRFVPNPSLKAEIAYSGETSLSYKQLNFTTDISIFLTYLKDGIVRIGLPKKQFMRINKDQIRTYGLELVSRYYNNNNLRSSFNFTFLSAMSKNDLGEFKDTLEYRPQIKSSFDLDYSISKNLNALLELEYTGLEFGLKEGSTGYQKLPDYFLANIRAAYSFSMNELDFEIYFRLNNLFDRLYYTQFGLPEAGRHFLIGANMEF